MKFRALLFALGGVAWALIPVIAYAQLVPCDGLSCDLCSVGKLIQNIINFLVGISIPIAVAMFGWAGILFFAFPEEPEKRNAGKRVFSSVFMGFVLVIGGWLVVQTILSVLVKDDFWIGGEWNNLQCVDPVDRINTMNYQVGEFINSALGTPPIATLTTSRYTCPSNFIQTGPGGSQCQGPGGNIQPATIKTTLQTTFLPGQAGRGGCAEVNLKPTFGSNANTMSCIAKEESACGVLSRKSVDKAIDGRMVSAGLFQINMSANQIMCPGQAPLNCPKAFSGALGSKNQSVKIEDEKLYERCKTAALTNSCNMYTAKYLLENTPKGIKNWTTAGKCGF